MFLTTWATSPLFLCWFLEELKTAYSILIPPCTLPVFFWLMNWKPIETTSSLIVLRPSFLIPAQIRFFEDLSLILQCYYPQLFISNKILSCLLLASFLFFDLKQMPMICITWIQLIWTNPGFKTKSNSGFPNKLHNLT